MPITAIAFIECRLDNQWSTLFGYPFENNKQMWSQHQSLDDTAQVSLVDIKNDRRYFQCKRGSIIQLVNNVLSFRSYEVEELAIDESKLFPKKQRMDQ